MMMIIPYIIRKRLTRENLLRFIILWISKAIFTLAILNIYMGSQMVSTTPHHSGPWEEGDLSLVKLMSHQRQSTNSKVIASSIDNSTKLKNSTMLRIDRNRSNQSRNNDRDNNSHSTTGMITPNLSDGTLQGKERLYDMLRTRNITQVDAQYWETIPKWETVIHNIFQRNTDEKVDANSNNNNNKEYKPIIHGLETCTQFQQGTSANPTQRRIAPAGMFNTGTNYLSVLLEYNCQNIQRIQSSLFRNNSKRGHGNEWEVPWGKHTPASYRTNYTKQKKNIKYTFEDVLPIVLIRNPYSWLKSMCRNPYTATWNNMHNTKLPCPHISTSSSKTNNDNATAVTVQYGAGKLHYQSLIHLWNEWYGQYFYFTNNNNTTFPRLIIRFEDIIYFPYEVTKQICTCAGATLGHRVDDADVINGTFHYVIRSAKVGSAHGKQRNGLIDSWLKYGSANPQNAYSTDEIHTLNKLLDPLLMTTFGYR